MRPQLEIFRGTELQLMPAPGVAAPRLWVRRVAIWAAPGQLIRDIALRPGLNIIWSRDPADDPEPGADAAGVLGHGSGKTMLCRLIRYCMGEKRFATDQLSDRISAVFPEGHVGAEVMVAGTPWAVLRPIGQRRRHVAIENGDLDAIASGEGTHTGIEPLVDAIETHVLHPGLAELVPQALEMRPWESALAWLSRDQDCRFAKVLEWRSPESDSRSPIAPLSASHTLQALRAFLRAITREEQRRQEEAASLAVALKDAERNRQEQLRNERRLRSILAVALSSPAEQMLPGPLGLVALRSLARERLAHVGNSFDQSLLALLEGARSELAEADDELTAANQAALTTKYHLKELELDLRDAMSRRAEATQAFREAEAPVCPVCDVPIDHALAAGCKLSRQSADLPRLRQERNALLTTIASLENQVAQQRGLASQEEARLLVARDSHARALSRIRPLERRSVMQNEAHNETWFAARRAIDQIRDLEHTLTDLEASQTAISAAETKLTSIREHLKRDRNNSNRSLARLRHLFNHVVRSLLGPAAVGTAKLDGNGLDLVIQLGGDRRSPALETLKILAFDLAALCLGIEGKTAVPAFLIHDSPREADLGISLYRRLFAAVHRLESAATQPPFQYIITTTTAPPLELRSSPWLALQLSGAPAAQRLLRRDL